VGCGQDVVNGEVAADLDPYLLPEAALNQRP
jgi:hypothetical protein